MGFKLLISDYEMAKYLYMAAKCRRKRR